ncbi:MAG: AAA family ATPase [Propionicimonas sp.]
MKIRKLEIENFRGVRELSWVVPKDRSFFTLIGAGDATKSTVLTAIEYALSDRWNIPFQDTDFHNGDLDEPIRIRVAVGDLPQELLALDQFGSSLCGLNPDGSLVHDPEDCTDPCVVVELTVASDLEPRWTAFRPGDDRSDAPPLKASQRARFGIYRLDDRVDLHLRWSRSSALSKLTERHGTKDTLTRANRAARDAVEGDIPAQLLELTEDLQTKARKIGSADLKALRPGLDTSLAGTQGNLALYEGAVPLMNYGLGTRRLVGAAVQQLANEGSPLVLVDEIEHGLEPHRLVHLLKEFKKSEAYEQVFVTTHSPTALQHLDASDLVMVRSHAGTTTMLPLAEPASLQSVLRSTPEAFLARRVVVNEGKTEYGFVLGLIQAWDGDETAHGHTGPSPVLGVVAVEGRSGTAAAKMASQLHTVGFDVVLFIDSDESDANTAAAELEAAGGAVTQWPDNACTEVAICNELDAAGIVALVELAVDVSDTPETASQSFRDQLATSGYPNSAGPIALPQWLKEGAASDLDAARTAVGDTARRKGWFKNVAKGQALADFVLKQPELKSGKVADVIAALEAAVFRPIDDSGGKITVPSTSSGEPEEPPSHGNAG